MINVKFTNNIYQNKPYFQVIYFIPIVGWLWLPNNVSNFNKYCIGYIHTAEARDCHEYD